MAGDGAMGRGIVVDSADMTMLEYARPELKAPPPRAVYWLAIILCGAPMVVGVGIALLYELTMWDALPSLGALCIVAGLVSVAIGGAVLIFHGWRHLRYGERPRKRVWLETLAGFLLMAMNFPVALLCIMWGESGMGRIEVTFVNQSGVPVTAITLISNAQPTVVGDLADGKQRKLVMRPAAEAELKGTALVGGVATQFVVDDYFESSGTERKTVRFKGPATAPAVE